MNIQLPRADGDYLQTLGVTTGLTASQVTDSWDSKELVILFHLAGNAVGRGHGVVVAEVLGLWPFSHVDRTSGRLGFRLHREDSNESRVK